MTRTRSVFLLVIGLTAFMVGPAAGAAGTADPRAERQETLDRRAALASEVDGLRASEQQLLSAVAALDAKIVAQTAKVEAARQASAVAEEQLAEERRALEAKEAEIDEISDQVVQRAVRSYMEPHGGIADMVEASDVAEEARRKALLSQVTATEADLIDQLDVAREDLARVTEAAERARAKAEERRRSAEAELTSLETAKADHARLQADLETRKQELFSEIEAQAAQDPALTMLINAATAGSAAAPDGAVGAGGCIFPARGPVTSEYGSRWGRLHAGLDIGAQSGSPIWAAMGGTVVMSGSQSGYGNTVVIDHGGGLTTLYAHQSRIAVSQGAVVAQGQVIGYVGSTGRSTGPHLHFEVRQNGTARNPRTCL